MKDSTKFPEHDLNMKSTESESSISGSESPLFARREFLIRAASLPALCWTGAAFGQPMPPTNLTIDGEPPPPPPPPLGGPVDVSIVPSRGRTVWNPGIYEGIPADNATGRADGVGGATQHGATLPAGSTASQIQAALDAAAAVATKTSRRFVRLGPGLFSLNATLNMRANVTLRGTLNSNGYTRDTVLRNASSTVVEFLPPEGWPDTQAQWGTIRSLTVDAAHGDATITVNDASNFNVGDIIQVDTLRDAPTSGENYALPIAYNPPNDGNWCWNGDGWWFMRQTSGADGIAGWPNSPDGLRIVTEAHEVLAKNGNVLTLYNPNAAVIKGSPIRSPMYRNPQAYLCRGVFKDVLRYAGLEDLKIEPGTTQGGTAVSLNQAAFCWVKNVEIHGNNPNTNFVNAVWLHIAGQTYRCEVTGCYFHGFDGYGPGGAYGIRLQGSDHYIHNNVLRQASKPIMLEHTGGGNVIAYNYVDEAFLQNGWPELAIGTHLAFVHYELYEGNWTTNMGADATHGNNGWITMFRNYARGANSSGGTNPPEPIRAVNIGGYQREMYSIGNVLLDPALTGRIASLIENRAVLPAGGYSTSTTLRSVYMLGWAPVLNGQRGNADEWDNGESGRNFHRHLDYDSFSASQYDNSSNPVKTLPNSLHRTTAPSYFAGYTWPWVNPAGATHTDRVNTLPAKARYDAGRA
jgi:hypothetical protein